MRLNQIVTLCTITKIKNEYGTVVESYEKFKDIDCVVTPTKDTTTLKLSGYDIKRLQTFITTSTIDVTRFVLKYNNEYYRVIADNTYYNNKRVLVGERI
jgi:hypothetical protein